MSIAVPAARRARRRTRLGSAAVALWAVVALSGPSGTALAVDPGPVLVRDIRGGKAGSQPYQFAAMNGRLYFEAGNRAVGGELFVSDGTAAGTHVLRDVAPGPDDSYPYRPARLGHRLLFFAISPTYGTEPFVTDGTEAGTRLLKDIYPTAANVRPWGFTVSGDRAFFSADDGPKLHGEELWITDGTRAGTHMVKDIRPGPEGSEPDWDARAVMDGVLYFVARGAGIYDSELWRSDGTAAGTWKVRDIVPGRQGSGPESLVVVGHRLFFSASDDIHGRELWVTDGTKAGTRLVKDVAPADESSEPMWLGDRGVRLGRWLVFPGMGVDYDLELWRSDGTARGTRLLKDIWPGGGRSGGPWYLTRAGGQVFFTAQDPQHGRELWVTDGTRVGTHLVKDIGPGAADGTEGGPQDPTIIAVGDAVYFSATDGHGYALWTSDGTAAGTHRSGPARPAWSYGPYYLTRVGDQLYFAAGDTEHGGELWRYRLPS